MRFAALLLAVAFVAGCASTPDYYISPAPVHIPKTATYWVETFELKLEGENERFMTHDQVKDGFELELINGLKKAKRYAASKDDADYLLDVSTVYTRRINDSQGGLISSIVDDSTVLLSVDFSYQVSVKKSGSEVLHFGKHLERLQPGGIRGEWENWKTLATIVTNKGNSSTEKFFIGVLPRNIVRDIEDIPSR